MDLSGRDPSSRRTQLRHDLGDDDNRGRRQSKAGGKCNDGNMVRGHFGNVPHSILNSLSLFSSLALLFFLIYRLRRKKLHRRQQRQNEDGDSVDSGLAGGGQNPGGGPNSYQMSAIPQRSYWYSGLAWWKSTNDDIFEARPAPPSYDDAMMHQQIPASTTSAGSEAECGSLESAEAESEAPPYSEIHLDPVIVPADYATALRPVVPAPVIHHHHRNIVPGAALVLPVPPPSFSHLNHVTMRPRSQQGQAVDVPAGGQDPVSCDEAAQSSVESRRHSRTLPHVIRRLRARSREGIVMPPEERDAVLQRFSLQLNLNLSASSTSSDSSMSTAMGQQGPSPNVEGDSPRRNHSSSSSSNPDGGVWPSSYN